MILPRIEFDSTKYIKRGFDPADASLIEYHKKEDYLIITEDHPMLDEGIKEDRKIIQLVDYFALLMLEGFLNKREFYHLIKKFRKMKNITNRKEKEILGLRIKL
jgi:uncharacterized protein YaiI (UPF0178 family)